MNLWTYQISKDREIPIDLLPCISPSLDSTVGVWATKNNNKTVVVAAMTKVLKLAGSTSTTRQTFLPVSFSFFCFCFSSFRLKAKLLRIPNDINVIIDVRKTTPQRENFSEYFTIFCVCFARYTFAILSATMNSVLWNGFRWPPNDKRAHCSGSGSCMSASSSYCNKCEHILTIKVNV